MNETNITVTEEFQMTFLEFALMNTTTLNSGIALGFHIAYINSKSPGSKSTIDDQNAHLARLFIAFIVVVTLLFDGAGVGLWTSSWFENYRTFVGILFDIVLISILFTTVFQMYIIAVTRVLILKQALDAVGYLEMHGMALQTGTSLLAVFVVVPLRVLDILTMAPSAIITGKKPQPNILPFVIGVLYIMVLITFCIIWTAQKCKAKVNSVHENNAHTLKDNVLFAGAFLFSIIFYYAFSFTDLNPMVVVSVRLGTIFCVLPWLNILRSVNKRAFVVRRFERIIQRLGDYKYTVSTTLTQMTSHIQPTNQSATPQGLIEVLNQGLERDSRPQDLPVISNAWAETTC